MIKKYDNLILSHYKIAFNPADLDEENGITPETRSHLDRITKKLLKVNKNLKNEIEDLISKYPQIPQFKNYLSTYYSRIGQTEKAFEINNIIVKEHPEYLFGKINFALQYLHNKNFSKIPEILGEAMEIKSLYPEREVFHNEEILSFFQVAIYYFIETDDLVSAEMRLKIMMDISEDHFKTIEAAERIEHHKFKKKIKNLKQSDLSPGNLKLNSKKKYKKTKTEPVFTNPEVKLLYQFGFQIDFKIIQNLLELPGESLIEDLKKVIADSISRYDFFKKETVFNFHSHSFVFHALYILAELKAENALDAVLDLLRQNEKILDYWLSDVLTEDIWGIIFTLGQNQLDNLRDYMFEEGNYTYARTEISQAVFQIAVHFPERKNEVIHWYSEVLNYFLEHKDNDEIIDTSLIGIMVCDVMDLKAIEIKETIIKLYELNLAETGICGNLKYILDNLYSKTQTMQLKVLPSIEKVYKENSAWEKRIEKKSITKLKAEKNEITYPELPEIYKNTGRNEKCPCGSGLKFKKCHGKGY